MQTSVLILAFATIHFGMGQQYDHEMIIKSDFDIPAALEYGVITKFILSWPLYHAKCRATKSVHGVETEVPAVVYEQEYNMAVSRYYQYDSNAHRMKEIDGSEQDLLVSKYVFYILVSYGLGTTVLVMVLAYKLRQMSKMKKALKHGHQNVPIHEMDVDSNCGITKQ
eukprot:403901_1